MMRPRDPDTEWEFFRTELGKTLRVDESDEGALSVDVLKEGVWSEAPYGMIGLRLSPGSRSHSISVFVSLVRNSSSRASQ